MTRKGRLQILTACLSVGVTLPIWYYLLYKILVAVQASELMFFLYRIYLPVSIFSAVLNKLAEGLSDDR